MDAANRYDSAHLPPLADAKLSALREAADAALGAVRLIDERRSAAYAEKSRLEQRLAHLRSPNWAGAPGETFVDEHGWEKTIASNRPGGGLRDDHPSVAPILKELSRAELDYQRSVEAVDRARARWTELGGLTRHLSDYLESLPGDVVVEPYAGEVAPASKGSITDAVEGRRRRLRELAADRHRVKSAPLPSSVAKAQARAEIERLAQAGEPDVLPALEAGEPIRWARQFLRLDVSGRATGGGEIAGAANGFTVDTHATLAWLLRDRFVEALESAVDEIADDQAALTDQERAERLAEVARDALYVQREEERLIETAEAAGMQIARRVDADVRAVLGADNLPPPA